MTAWDGDRWAVWDAAAVVAEIDRELAERSAADAALAGKGRIDPREADWRARIVADIRADLSVAFLPLGAGEIERWCERFGPSESWTDKVRWIERELEQRRADFPALVAKGRLTAADAAARIKAIGELRRLYWERLFMWEPPEGPALDYLRALRAAAQAGTRIVEAVRRSAGARLHQEFVRRHMALVAAEQGQAQGELAA